MYAKYNYLSNTSTRTGLSYSCASVLSDIVSMLCGVTTPANLSGKVLLNYGAVGITSGSNVVTWAGANSGVNLEVGQGLHGVGWPLGAQIGTITNQVGFTVVASDGATPINATVTSAAAVICLSPTANLPPATIGNTTLTASFASGSSTITWTSALSGNAFSTVNPGMAVIGYGIPNGAFVGTVTASTSFTIVDASGNPVVTTAAVNPASLVLIPANNGSVVQACDTANTSILTTYSQAGWEIWDGYAFAGRPYRVCLRAPNADITDLLDNAQYKYMLLSISDALVHSSGGIALNIAEYWTNTSHVGVNLCADFDVAAQQRTTIGTAASMLISADKTRCVMQSTIAAGVGSLTYNTWTGVFERSRLSPWDTVSAGYPVSVVALGGNTASCALFSATGTNAYYIKCPRIKNPAGGDVDPALFCNTQGWSGISGNNTLIGPVNSAYTTSIVSKVPDGVGGFYVSLNDVRVVNHIYSFLGGSLSEISDIWLGPAYAQNQDQVEYSGKIYSLWQNSSTSATITATMAVPFG